MVKRPYRQQRRSSIQNESVRIIRGTTDLMMAGGTLMIGAGALGLVSGVSKSLQK